VKTHAIPILRRHINPPFRAAPPQAASLNLLSSFTWILLNLYLGCNV
jgi:hypothetical protein